MYWSRFLILALSCRMSPIIQSSMALPGLNISLQVQMLKTYRQFMGPEMHLERILSRIVEFLCYREKFWTP